MERNLSEFIRRGIEKSIDETRSTLLRVISHEVRQFLDGRDPVADLRRALAGMKLEISAEVKFVPSGPSVRVADATVELGETDSPTNADDPSKSAMRSKKRSGRKPL